ncbi:MAG TPA: hypothetical protein VE888_09030, partial [Streptosporangiaceae bacterium]|nr:hypothetical protein [Streptosporangiaceae bacterium]
MPVLEHGIGVELTHALDQPGHEAGPAGLVGGTQPGSVVAVEVLVEQDQVTPVRVVLKEPGSAVDGALPVTVPQEGADQAAGQLLGHLEQRHHRPGAGRAFDPQVVAVVPVVLQQGPDQQQVDREPDRPAPVGVAAEHAGGRLGRLVLDRVLAPGHVDRIGMLEVPARDGADAVRPQEPPLVQHPGQDAPQLVLVHQGQQPPPLDAGHERVGDVGQQVLVAPQEGSHVFGDAGIAVDHVGLDHRGGAQRQQPHQGPDLHARTRAVGQAEHVVEKAVLLVPHLVGVFTERVHRGRDPEEMLDELEHEPLVGLIMLQQSQGKLEHVLAEHRHPGRAVSLLQPSAGRQRRAAVEHADVVQAEEAPLEHIAAGGILAVHPPGEVQQQLGEALLQERKVHLPQVSLQVRQEQGGHGVDRGVHVPEVPLIGRHLAGRVEVTLGQHQVELALGEVGIDHGQRNAMERQIPGGIPRVLPFVGHGHDIMVDHVEPRLVAGTPPGRRSQRVPVALTQPAVHV